MRQRKRCSCSHVHPIHLFTIFVLTWRWVTCGWVQVNSRIRHSNIEGVPTAIFYLIPNLSAEFGNECGMNVRLREKKISKFIHLLKSDSIRLFEWHTHTSLTSEAHMYANRRCITIVHDMCSKWNRFAGIYLYMHQQMSILQCKTVEMCYVQVWAPQAETVNRDV